MQSYLKFLYAALIAATLVMAASAFWLISGVVKEAATIENSSRDSLIGNAAQTNNELFKFIDALAQLESDDPAASKEILTVRFDILWSRLETNTSGTVGVAFSSIKGLTDKLSQIQKVLVQTEAEILTLKQEDKKTTQKLLRSYRALMPIAHSINLTVTASASEAATSLHQDLLDVDYWAKILLPSMLLTGFTVALILLIDRKALNVLAKSLEGRVQVRTKELQQSNRALKKEVQERKKLEEKLVQSQKMEMIGQLTGGIAHDFNNLLAIIQGNAELLESLASEQTQKFTKPIIRAAHRGSDLTQRLLAFSRQQPLKPTPVDLSRLAKELVELMSRAMTESVEIEIHHEDDLWLALADQNQIENALLNLAVNAEHAMPAGGKITISIKNHVVDEIALSRNPDAAPGEYVMLSVSDTGTGIPEDLRMHVFEPFFTTKEVGKGSGLGLSMVYGFIRQSGGFIDLYSEVNIGTTIKLFLPRCNTKAVGGDIATIDYETTLGSGETIFLLEDDPDVLHLAKTTLESLNYAVIEANSVTRAREILKVKPTIDAILSDVILPGGISGPEFFKEIEDQISDIPIIYMSGYPAVAAKRKKLLDESSILLSKPFQRHELADVIKSQLKEPLHH
jgi:signal transduction histidine kinase/ActR/RegA family two-component response regulator